MGMLAWAMSGCFLTEGVHAEVTTLDGEHCKAAVGKDASNVEVYFGVGLPEREFDQVAHLEMSASEFHDTAELLDELRRSAAACGADAVIGVDKKYGVNVRTYLLIDDEDVEERHILTGVAVRYREPTPRFDAWED